MNAKKITMLFGTLCQPLTVGKSAIIALNGQTLRTSRVVSISLVSPQQVIFETMNTNYVLTSPAVEQAVRMPSVMAA